MEKAEGMVEGYDYALFASDEKTVLAITRLFEIIGEAARNMPAELREQHPEVPWREMIAMRNRLAHAYFETDFSLMWRSMRDVFPSVKPSIAAIVIEQEPKG
ncbi:MAG: DUF86 domain-containing protein [FCB group bacterium]|nr:DUF86 domain-containing protein [FCB group bacterium]